MNEKLTKLAELFAQRADIDSEILKLIGGGITGNELPEDDEEAPAPKKIKRNKAGKYNKANPMPEEVKAEIRAKSAGGMSVAALVKEFGVSNSSIFKVLKS